MLNRSKRGENMSRLATEATPYVLGETSGEHDDSDAKVVCSTASPATGWKTLACAQACAFSMWAQALATWRCCWPAWLARRRKSSGVDLDGSALATARQRVAEAGLNSVSFRIGNFLDYESDRTL